MAQDDELTDERSHQTDVSKPWSAERRPSEVIIEELSSLTGIDPIDLPVLYDYVNPEALDALMLSESTHSDNSIRVTFEYDGYIVSCHNQFGISIEELSDSDG